MVDDKLSMGYCLNLDPLIQAGGVRNPSDNNKINMAVFSSADNGLTWDRKTLCKEYSEIHAFLVDPNNKNNMYAGGYFYFVEQKSWIRKSKLFTSKDGGKTWEESGKEIFGRQSEECIWSLKTSPFNSQVIYAATEFGIYTSEDAGKTWKAPAQKIDANNIICDPKDKNTLYAGGQKGFWTSRDGGKTWEQNNKGLTIIDLMSLDYDPVNKIMYAGTRGSGLYRLKLGK